MPSLLAAASLPSSTRSDPTPVGACASPALQLAQASRPAGAERQQAVRLADASRALWVATLSLMTAFMQNQAPAHRYLLARRISRNFETLARQDCFDLGCRASFERLAGRWDHRSQQYAPQAARPARRWFGLFS